MTSSKNKVLFLDVDGVLNNSDTDAMSPDGFIGVDKRNIEHLKKIMELEAPIVVLTSTWKDEWRDEEGKQLSDGKYLEDCLKESGITIHDRTWDNTTDRGKGILKYLEQNMPESFVILDDEEFDYRKTGIFDHLVRTKYKRGLTKEDAERAIEILNM